MWSMLLDTLGVEIWTKATVSDCSDWVAPKLRTNIECFVHGFVNIEFGFQFT